ncbi:hypothetical protein [Propionicimonas sp.]|uniref:hypothetical protein n=1 Tax=Propionicimonas sp. TaxID=1955623 RepID=UPI0039E2D352
MTQAIAGSRFLDLDADGLDGDLEYTPRHLRAVTLSPELQQALDAAFARDTVPVPEPVPGPVSTAPAPVVDEPGEESPSPSPARLSLVVPELVVYPPILPDGIFRPAADETSATPSAVQDEPVDEDAPAEASVEHRFLADAPVDDTCADEVGHDDGGDAQPVAARIAVDDAPVQAPVATAAVSFPDPAAYAAKRFSGLPGVPASGGLFRRKVDISRLMVPVRAEAVGS